MVVGTRGGSTTMVMGSERPRQLSEVAQSRMRRHVPTSGAKPSGFWSAASKASGEKPSRNQAEGSSRVAALPSALRAMAVKDSPAVRLIRVTRPSLKSFGKRPISGGAQVGVVSVSSVSGSTVVSASSVSGSTVVSGSTAVSRTVSVSGPTVVSVSTVSSEVSPDGSTQVLLLQLWPSSQPVASTQNRAAGLVPQATRSRQAMRANIWIMLAGYPTRAVRAKPAVDALLREG